MQAFIAFQHYHVSVSGNGLSPLLGIYRSTEVTQRLVGHNSVGSKTKSIRPRPKLQDQPRPRPRPRPRPAWDRSCHKTVVSDPKTDVGGVGSRPNVSVCVGHRVIHTECY